MVLKLFSNPFLLKAFGNGARSQLTKSKMAKSMQTSRAALDRLLDPEYDSVTLRTLDKAARAVGKRIKIDLVDVI